MQTLDCICGAYTAPLARRQASEGEQAFSSLFQAFGDSAVLEPPFADGERYHSRVYTEYNVRKPLDLPLRISFQLELESGPTKDGQMKRNRFTEEQIIAVLKEHEAGAKTADLARKHGISEATFYNWKAKYGGMDVSEAKRLRALEDENAKLKKLLAEQMLDAAALRELLSKKW